MSNFQLRSVARYDVTSTTGEPRRRLPVTNTGSGEGKYATTRIRTVEHDYFTKLHTRQRIAGCSNPMATPR